MRPILQLNKKLTKLIVPILSLGMLNNAAYAVVAIVYFEYDNPQASQQAIADAFANGLTPQARSTGAELNQAINLWNYLRRPLTYPYFFQAFSEGDALVRALDPSRSALNGVIFGLEMDNNFYNLSPTVASLLSRLNIGADPDGNVERSLNSMITTLEGRYIVGFNGGIISNRIIVSASIFVDNQPLGLIQVNPNFIESSPIRTPESAGYRFNNMINQPLDSTAIQVLPPRSPNILTRVLSFFACGSGHRHSTTLNKSNNNDYDCSNPKTVTVQEYNDNYLKELNSLRINPNDNVFKLDSNASADGLIRLVPDLLSNNPDNMIVIPYYIQNK